MHDRRLTIWTDTGLGESAAVLLREGVIHHRLLLHSKANPAGLDDADIAFGQPDPEAVMRSRRLRWVHITSAGYTRYDRDDLREAMRLRGAMLTNSSHVYDEPCAQHAVAMMLSLARQLPASLETQR